MGIRDWWQDRQQTKEIERSMEVRRGKAKVRKHIQKQKGMSKKLWNLGKRALMLEDPQQFHTIGKQYLWTLEDVRRWERYLLAFESIEARRDQARAMSEFMGAVRAMSTSMMASANPKALAKTQRDLEKGIAQAQNMEQVLDLMMEMTDETIFSMEEVEDEELDTSIKELERAMGSEQDREIAEQVADTSLDARIAAGLKQIEEQMSKNK